MSHIHSPHSLATELDLLARQPLDQADDAVLVRAARAVWYSTENLEGSLEVFLHQRHSELELRRVGYLLERLTQFACASDSRVSEVHRALEHVSSCKRTDTDGHGRRDILALAWGLEQGLGLKVQALLPYQTRHFEATQR